MTSPNMRPPARHAGLTEDPPRGETSRLGFSEAQHWADVFGLPIMIEGWAAYADPEAARVHPAVIR